MDIISEVLHDYIHNPFWVGLMLIALGFWLFLALDKWRPPRA